MPGFAPPPPWPHQPRAVAAVLAAIASGVRRMLLTAPPRAGKTRIICDLIAVLVAQGWYVVVYTNRRALVRQLHANLTGAGIPHGIRCDGYETDLAAVVQIASLDTERSRTLKKGLWLPHGEGRRVLAVIDEAHLNATTTVKDLMDYHISRGGAALGVTATPIGLGGFYDELIVASTPSELRACGALVVARHFAPTEPDWLAFKKLRNGRVAAEGQDLTAPQARALMNVPTIFGYIWEWFQKLNPHHLPTLCFGPDVEGSLWIAERFWGKGVPWAHMSHKHVWINGKPYASDDAARDDVLAMSRAGEIVGISTRYLLREGVDLPWVRHVIAANVFGSLQSYLQAMSRGLGADNDPETIARFGPKEFTVVQDHGANYLRHGSLGADRDWDLSDTPESLYHTRADRLRSHRCRRCRVQLRPRDPWCPACHFFNEIEPTRCRQCSLVLIAGKCPICGWRPTSAPRTRAVIGTDGQPIEITGDHFVPRRTCTAPDGPKRWEQMYYRGTSLRWDATFRAMEAKFAEENGWQWPDRDWPLMPTNERDWFLNARDVPVERLRGDPELLEKARRHLARLEEKACVASAPTLLSGVTDE